MRFYRFHETGRELRIGGVLPPIGQQYPVLPRQVCVKKFVDDDPATHEPFKCVFSRTAFVGRVGHNPDEFAAFKRSCVPYFCFEAEPCQVLHFVKTGLWIDVPLIVGSHVVGKVTVDLEPNSSPSDVVKCMRLLTMYSSAVAPLLDSFYQRDYGEREEILRQHINKCNTLRELLSCCIHQIGYRFGFYHGAVYLRCRDTVAGDYFKLVETNDPYFRGTERRTICANGIATTKLNNEDDCLHWAKEQLRCLLCRYTPDGTFLSSEMLTHGDTGTNSIFQHGRVGSFLVAPIIVNGTCVALYATRSLQSSASDEYISEDAFVQIEELFEKVVSPTASDQVVKERLRFSGKVESNLLALSLYNDDVPENFMAAVCEVLRSVVGKADVLQCCVTLCDTSASVVTRHVSNLQDTTCTVEYVPYPGSFTHRVLCSSSGQAAESIGMSSCAYSEQTYAVGVAIEYRGKRFGTVELVTTQECMYDYLWPERIQYFANKLGLMVASRVISGYELRGMSKEVRELLTLAQSRCGLRDSIEQVVGALLDAAGEMVCPNDMVPSHVGHEDVRIRAMVDTIIATCPQLTIVNLIPESLSACVQKSSVVAIIYKILTHVRRRTVTARIDAACHDESLSIYIDISGKRVNGAEMRRWLQMSPGDMFHKFSLRALGFQAAAKLAMRQGRDATTCGRIIIDEASPQSCRIEISIPIGKVRT